MTFFQLFVNLINYSNKIVLVLSGLVGDNAVFVFYRPLFSSDSLASSSRRIKEYNLFVLLPKSIPPQYPDFACYSSRKYPHPFDTTYKKDPLLYSMAIYSAVMEITVTA